MSESSLLDVVRRRNAVVRRRRSERLDARLKRPSVRRRSASANR
jgi:hypothetical protein